VACNTKIRLAAGLRPEPLWEIMHSPIPLVAMGGLLLKEERGGEGGEGMRPTSKGDGREEGNSAQVSPGE